MPTAADPGAERSVAEIVASTSDDEFLHHVIDGMRSTNCSALITRLDALVTERDADVEKLCSAEHQDIIGSILKLDQGRSDVSSLGTDILDILRSYKGNATEIVSRKKDVVDSSKTRLNINESTEKLKGCLELLRHAKETYDLIGKQNYYAAARALNDLQNMLCDKNKNISRYTVTERVQQSIPVLRNRILGSASSNLNIWLSDIRENTQVIGERVIFHIERRLSRRKESAARRDYPKSFKINSPVELVANETEQCNSLDTDDTGVHVDWTPLLECLHVHEALGLRNRFISEYAATRRAQMDLIIPATLDLGSHDNLNLMAFLETMAGFAIVERATLRKTENLRSSTDVDDLWESMSQCVIVLVSSDKRYVANADIMHRIIKSISVFMNAMEAYEYDISTLNTFLITLFENYLAILTQQCSDICHEIISNDDYMPMPIVDMEEYDKVIEACWYAPELAREDITLPFSQLYPLCSIELRSFLKHIYSGYDICVRRTNVIEDMIQHSVDEILCENICERLLERLNLQYIGQSVQVLTNLAHFERACEQLQSELAAFSKSRAGSGLVVLHAPKAFRSARAKAYDQILELVASKIEDLIGTSEYDWRSNSETDGPSNYMTELTRYIADINGSILICLPQETRELVYFELIGHVASAVLTLPLDPSARIITLSAVHQLSVDVQYFASFATSSVSLSVGTATAGAIERPIVHPAIDELLQSVALMASESPKDFSDIDQLHSRYGKVDAHKGNLLLEKVLRGKEEVGQRKLP